MRDVGRRTSAARLPRLGLLAVVAMVVSAAGAPPASGATVTCGQSVATDVVLDHDLANCPGDGLVAAADGITVDLNGHTIAGVGGSSPDTVGVLLGDHSNVTVRNGSLRGFTTASRRGTGSCSRAKGASACSRWARGRLGRRAAPEPRSQRDRVQHDRGERHGGVRGRLGDEIAYNHLAGGGISLIGNGTRVEHNRAGVIELLALSRGAFVADNSVNRITASPSAPMRRSWATSSWAPGSRSRGPRRWCGATT